MKKNVFYVDGEIMYKGNLTTIRGNFEADDIINAIKQAKARGFINITNAFKATGY